MSRSPRDNGPSHVALLRGVNVGGKNSVAMAALRTLFESLGFTAVSTYIQSGNVLFSPPGSVEANTIEAAISSRLEIEIAVVVRSHEELRGVVEASPFAGADPSKVHIGFMARAPSHGAVASLDATPFLPEQFVIEGTEIYLHLPTGMGRAKLPAYLDRRLAIPTTVRSLRTVTKLVELGRR